MSEKSLPTPNLTKDSSRNQLWESDFSERGLKKGATNRYIAAYYR